MTYLRQTLLLAVFAALGFALYILLFWLGVGSSVSILFYRGVALALVAALITGLIAAWLGRRSDDASLPVAAAAVSLSLNVCFLVLLPVTVDRSVTVYLLSNIERHQETGISPSGLERTFIDGYVVGMGAIDRRIGEQQKSGNIILGKDGKVRLTEQGERFMRFSRLVARLFGTDPRFVQAAATPVPPAPAKAHGRRRSPSKR